ncbi:MAG TPA: YoaK family protein, partial [Acidobacteriaceae bacterium]|nr:YoaK family protein [Acidobacteriaceae bacterium]
MPLHYLRRLTGKERTQAANRDLAFFLAFVAGAADAGGYLAFRRYTSHMSGVVSGMSDNLALGNGALLLAGAGALVSFVAGAALTAMLVNWGRRRNRHGAYAVPLVVEAGLLLVFG